MSKARPLEVGSTLQRLSRGLIAYGVIGLVVAVVGLAALLIVSGRIGGLRDQAETTVARLTTSMERTATVLHEASATAQSFTVTVEESAKAVASTATTITETRAGLASLEAQLRSVTILGASPLGASADSVARISASLEGLDTRMTTIATALETNRDALASNATSLGQLGDSTATMADLLGSGAVEDVLGDVQLIIVVTLLVFAAWSVVPAVGALVAGIWLRQELERRARTPEVGLL